MEDKRKIIRKEPSWKDIGDFLTRNGWYTEKIQEDKVIFERGRQKIVAKKVLGDKWKVEYYSGKIMDDMAGITNRKFAKKEVVEMGITK